MDDEKLDIYEFIKSNHREFKHIDLEENKDFLFDFKDMIYKKGCIFNHELLYKYGIYNKRDTNYIKNQQENYEQGIDYDIKTELINKGKTVRYYYMLTAETFRMLTMCSKSESANKINRYFIDLEKIVKLYLEYEVEIFLREKETQINKAIKRYKKIKSKTSKNYKRNPGYVYVQTTISYMRQNCYKIGFSSDALRREGEIDGVTLETVFLICSIKCDFIKDSTFESYIHDVLNNFRVKENKEFFNQKYIYIKKLIEFMICKFKFSSIEVDLEIDKYIEILKINKLKYYDENDENVLVEDLCKNSNINNIFCNKINDILIRIFKGGFTKKQITPDIVEKINKNIFTYTFIFEKSDVINILDLCQVNYIYDKNEKKYVLKKNVTKK